MPHVHGVFWIDDEEKNQYFSGDKYDASKVPELIDKWVSCSLNTGDEFAIDSVFFKRKKSLNKSFKLTNFDKILSYFCFGKHRTRRAIQNDVHGNDE